MVRAQPGVRAAPADGRGCVVSYMLANPFARLKRSLKSEIDEDAWPSLNRTGLRAFPLPETGKIAVKVLNDYGDEVVKVFGV